MSLKHPVPEWAKGVVWYQIYPERFCNGIQNINPELKDQKNSYPHDTTSPWKLHPWTSDWYKLEEYEKQNELTIWENLHRRRYGGDLQGIINKLDYLKEMGVGAIYLNPIFTSPSHHKYDGATYHHVDPTFGPDPEGDRALIAQETPDDPSTWVWTSADSLFLNLIQEVHHRDMRIIIDGVFNHVGLNFWAFQDLKKNQKESKFSSWFKIAQWEDKTANKDFAVYTWEGFKELPEWKQSRYGLVKGPKKYVFDSTRRWMDPHGNGDISAGIDGWRLDVAHCIKHTFWKDWKDHVRSINPDAYITGEVILSPEQQSEYLQGDEFDAVMHYHFAFTAFHYFLHDNDGISTLEFANATEKLISSFPWDINLAMQTLYGSHDTSRILSHIKNRHLFTDYTDWWDYFSRSRGENPEYDTSAPDIEEFELLKLLVLFQMTFPGSPMIYYGDELGMWGANDPCCRKPMLWPEMNFEAERFLPDGNTHQASTMVTANIGLQDFYKRLIRIRNTTPALQKGNFVVRRDLCSEHIFAFERNVDEQQILVLLNKCKEVLVIPCPEAGADLLNNIEYKKDEMIALPKQSGVILKVH